MSNLGMTEQQLPDCLTRIPARYECRTDLELRMLGALAAIDVVFINDMESNCNRWRLDTIHNHAKLTPPIEYELLYTRLRN